MRQRKKRYVVAFLLIATCAVAAATMLQIVSGRESKAPSLRGVDAFLTQERFIAQPGETVVVPVTTKALDGFDGRIGITQGSEDLLQLASVHWVSGTYLFCVANADDPMSLPIPLATSYGQRRGSTLYHNFLVTLPRDMKTGEYLASIKVIVGNEVATLPFTVEVIN
jgi:hypothetical protein